jgi:phosphosulfolactate synthase (CoM biosynthesis protein A)
MRIKDRSIPTYDRLEAPTRPGKPRKTGLTVMIDMGPSDFGWTGPTALKDLLEYGCEFIDYAKIYAVNGLVYPVELIKQINGIYRDYDVKPFCGGILFETAFFQNAVDELITHLKRIDATGLEISENYLELTSEERKREIDRFQKAGFEVVYEFGRKQPTEAIPLDRMGVLIEDMVGLGADHVILEQSELDMLAEARPADYAAIKDQSWYPHVVIEPDPFRFPDQHIELIREFGPEVSLCNVAPEQVLRLEGFRRGIGRAVNFSFLSEPLKQRQP